MSFIWPTTVTEKATLPTEAQVICKQGHVRWVDWDDRHAGKDPTHAHYGFTCCNICPRGQDHTTYTGKFRWKEAQ